ncbi:MAG: hypothetical protein ABW168_03045 [Sedimenticola sp.]
MLRDLSLVFEPSTLDISEYQGMDSYGCGLREVELEVRQVIEEIQQTFYAAPKHERANIPKLSFPPKDSHGYMPDLLLDISLLITSGTLSAVFYKLISSWITHRNGRKLRIRLPSGFEVEATQLNKDEFQRLVEVLYAQYGQQPGSDLKPSELRKLGFKVATKKDIENHRQALRGAYSKKTDEILRKDNDKA